MATKPDDDLLYRFRAAHKKRDGWCRITARGIEWASDRENKSLDVPYAELASHEVSPEDHPKALLRLSRAAGKALVLTILEATPDRAYATLCDAKLAITACIRRRRRRGEHQPVEPSKERPTAKRAEVMRRAKLLQSDEALQKRHKELVQSGAVDEEAFWAAATGRRAPAAEKAVRAPSNELLVDAPREGESTGRTVTFSLSPEKIAFVFSMYPAVRRAHAAHVPKVLRAASFHYLRCVDGVAGAGLAVGISHRWRAGGPRAPRSHRRDGPARHRAAAETRTQCLAPPSRHGVASMAYEPYQTLTPRRSHEHPPTPPARRRRDPTTSHTGHVRGSILG